MNNLKQLLSVFQNSKLTSKSTVELTGNKLAIVTKHLSGYNTHKRLLPKGFHFSTKVNRSDLSRFKNEKILDIIHSDALNYISINYDGLNFLDNDKVPLFPYFEIYLTYKNKIFGDSIVNQLIQHFNLPLTNESSNIFSFEGEKIKVKQIDTNQIVISTLKTEYKIENTLLNPIFSGDPKKLVKVTNAGWKGLFLELIPGYKKTKNFLESMTGVSTYQNRNGEQIICLSFKQDTDALHSFLKFVLSIQ